MATINLSSEVDTPKANTSPPTTILLGLSGPSSSGKTTLARLLRSIFNLTIPSSSSGTTYEISLFILHQDDFYLTDALVPVITVSSTEFGTRDLQDWDCVESLDLDIFESTLRHVKQHGTVPEGSVSKEDQNAVGESGVTDDEVLRLRGVVEERLRAAPSTTTTTASKRTGDSDSNSNSSSNEKELRICILDGFLLYPPPPEPTSSSSPSTPLKHLHALSTSLLTPRLFLPSTRTQTLIRRARRTGYVTLEGFWTDPPGYVEDVVWPNFARDHAWMYSGGDVDAGSIDEERLLNDHGVRVCPGRGAWDMQRVLAWAVDVLVTEVEGRIGLV